MLQVHFVTRCASDLVMNRPFGEVAIPRAGEYVSIRDEWAAAVRSVSVRDGIVQVELEISSEEFKALDNGRKER